MKWLALLCLILGLLLASADDSQEARSAGEVDYTSRYAQLASEVPSDVNVPDLIASLSAAGV
ncbi:uncharacterized protein LOC142984184 [Anticarsia gemmatalis]|uniref:uncharacterized protein LOC142984184 n=1 Tax=Anticarsia gemmatalis TaxID=129554 RepID=UPI003F766FEE